MGKSLAKAVFILLVGCYGVYSQQDAQYTQYMYNTLSFNPAYTGSRGYLSSFLLHRSQWVGLDGAPSTQALGIHSPIGEKKRMGLGLSVVNDEIGPAQETYFNVNFSYTIQTSAEGKLAFGISGGGHLLDIRFDELSAYTRGDPFLANNVDNKFSPQVGAGAYYYTEKTYLGVSVPNLLETDHFDEGPQVSDNSASYLARERLHYHVIGGHVFDLSDNIKLKPAVLGKIVSGAPLQVDLSANFLINERATLGAAYRWNAALSFLAGFQVNDQLMVGFAYDREVTDLGRTEFNDGSFEVFLQFELLRNVDRLITPRFF